jgi:hypothetical protein
MERKRGGLDLEGVRGPRGTTAGDRGRAAFEKKTQREVS